MSIPISVIISTYNRADHLAVTLAALEQQRYEPFEIVVIDGPSTDHTQEVLARWAGRLKTGHCAQRTTTLSRNIGLQLAAGDMAVFIDDDARPAHEEWLARYSAAMAADQDGVFGAWGGTVMIGKTDSAEFHQGEVSDYCFHVFHPNWPRPALGRHWRQTVIGGNMACRMDALRAIGGFDQRYRYYAEEPDVVWRLAKRGWQTAFMLDNAVHHYPARVTAAHPMKERAWRTIAHSDALFAATHGQDPLPVRAIKTLLYGRHKHFMQELEAAYAAGELNRQEARRFRRDAWKGRLKGCYQGVFCKPALCDFSSTPPPFRPFLS